MTRGKNNDRLKAITGMHDWRPPESRRLQAVEQLSCLLLQRFGYAEVRTPLLEQTPLFARSIGGTTDIVEKEMYTFTDRDGDSLALRPEGTASAVRAFIEHDVGKSEPVTRWYYLGPMYRHERAQRGRYRQFYQIGAEALGVESPGIDAEMIELLVQLLDTVGLDDVSLLLNSLGCPECRPKHRQALVAYLDPRQQELCDDCQRRLAHNPLRVLDCKKQQCKKIAADAPHTLELLCGACQTHWDGLLADLEVLDIGYSIDHRLVRGLDYYTRTTFELTSTAGGLGSQNTIVGGGRYDGLVEQLGGSPTPAIGFGMGLERLLLALPQEQPAVRRLVDLCFVTRGDAARRYVLPLARQLRQAGVGVEVDHRGASIKSQMKRANRSEVPYVAIVGDSEIERGIVTLKRMELDKDDPSKQEEVSAAELLSKLQPS